MMEIHHMSGAGNTFLVLDARDQGLDLSRMATELCKPHRVDGLMAIDHSETADFRLHFYNADGSRGEMCGNGSRCICRYAYEHGLAGEHMTVQTDAGIVTGWRIDECHYRVALNLPGVLDLNRKDNIAYVELGSPGVPHAVMELPDLKWDMAEKLRRQMRDLRYDPAFPKGANVNFYAWVDESTVRLLTYERGVEDFTLACGTGSASTAVVLWLKGQLPTGQLTVESQGGDLKIQIEGTDRMITQLLLEGPSEILDTFTW